jgi:ribosomal protein S18 acetylase RimI-like enzyme
MKQPVKIVPFEARYAPLFDQLNRAWIEEYFSVEPFDDAVLTQPEKMILATGGEIWFAQLGADVVGACALLPLTEGMLEFTKLGVSPEARGAGVARSLLRHCALRAREKGAHTLRIFTSMRLVPACTLYRAEGFTEVAMSASERQRYARADIMFDLPL